MSWDASTHRIAEASAAMADSTGLGLQKEVRSNSKRFALFFADGIVGAAQCLIRCARTGDLVLLNDLLASRGIEADYKTPQVRPWYLVLQRRAYVTCVSEKKVVCLVKSTVIGAWWRSAAVQGNTPLYIAALRGHLEIVQALLAHGADVAMRCSTV